MIQSNIQDPKVEKVAEMRIRLTLVVFLMVFLVMFLSHVFLLTKALQCSYEEEIFLVFRPQLNFTDLVTSAADKEMISRMRDCKYGTFLEDKFVFVDFLFDCVSITRQDGTNQSTGLDCGNSSYLDRKPKVFFNDNKTVFLDLLKTDNGIFYSKDGLYICS